MPYTNFLGDGIAVNGAPVLPGGGALPIARRYFYVDSAVGLNGNPSTYGNWREVTETDTGGFVQADWNLEIMGLPVAGAFCNGEIGPVAGTTHLHGYTACWGLLVPSPQKVKAQQGEPAAEQPPDQSRPDLPSGN